MSSPDKSPKKIDLPVLASSKRLSLTPLHPNQALSFVKWFNDSEVFGLMRDMDRATNVEEQVQWILESGRDARQQIFAIYHRPDGELIGDGGFINVNFEDRKAEIGIVIGEKKYWGRGLGTEAIRLLCEYGFDRLRLHNIIAEHYAINPKSLHVFKKVGFQPFGTRLQSRWIGGRLIDVHYTQILPGGLRDDLTPPSPSLTT